MEEWANTFEEILDEYRRDDGSMWSGAALQRATGGRVSRNYVSSLRRGEIKEPSFAKILAISEAMGVPLERWRSAFRDEGGGR